MSSGKQLVRGKSGMRMISVSETERSPFLIEEPQWTADDQVSGCNAFLCASNLIHSYNLLDEFFCSFNQIIDLVFLLAVS